MTDPTTFDAKQFLRSCSTCPGVYCMYDSAGVILYVGKAKNLKNRLSSYFQKNVDSAKTRALVSHIDQIEVTIAQSENDALLLENNLIKSLRPRYNVLFRDDKSYPYLYLSKDPHYPRMGFYRGTVHNKSGEYFGPYTSAHSARESLNLLQKIFKLRSCDDVFFKNRSRPCLQYQIKRCTAPCVNAISPDDYQSDVRHARMFLQGKNNAVINELIKQMDLASQQLNYEQAAGLRDQIALMRKISQQQCVMTTARGDADIIGLATNHAVCLVLMFMRHGEIIGSKRYFPKVPADYKSEEVIAEFISQHYLSEQGQAQIPHEIILPCSIADSEWLSEGLSQQAAHKVKILSRVQQKKQQWLDMARQTAEQALLRYLSDKSNTLQRLENLTDVLQLPQRPNRIECFDISHTMGEATVASCVVFDANGPAKSEYRRFNIKNIQAGDDYAAMYQALSRRYSKVKKEEGKIPDILLIDGGKGQISQAEQVLQELQLTEIQILGIAKGPSRKPGLEQLYVESKGHSFSLAPDSPALHLLQFVRDEAHRFAITGHRARRGKARKISSLESIPGVGAKRRRELLRQFGGLQELKRASIEDIAKVPSISKALAKKIYLALHD